VATTSLYDQSTDPAGNQRNNWSGSVGNRFASADSRYLAAVSYYCPQGTARPSQVQLYDVSTGNAVWQRLSPNWQGTAPGWITAELSATEAQNLGALVANHTYEANLLMGGSSPWWEDGGPVPPSGTNISFEGSFVGNPNGMGFSSSGSGRWCISVTLSDSLPTGSTGGAATPVDVSAVTDANLAEWLSSNSATNTHQSDGLPWLTKAKVDAGLNLAGGLQALSDSLAHTIQMASDWFAGGSSTIFTDLKNRLLGASGGGGSAFYGPDGTQVSAGVEALLARSTNAQVGFPASPWAMTDETDWDDCIVWPVPADLYVVTVTTVPPLIPDNGRCGVPVRYRLAWWTPLNGEFAQERRWIDFEKVHLVDPAGRMPGLLLQTYQGGAGHVQAWVLNA